MPTIGRIHTRLFKYRCVIAEDVQVKWEPWRRSNWNTVTHHGAMEAFQMQ